MKRILFALLVVAFVASACALPPEKPVTREELMQTGIYQKFVVEESPEQVLNMLNTYGEAILKGKRNIPGEDYLVDIKLLATAEGIDVLEYDR